jgi:C_GCAxxG_C_C family probable redox protein
LIPKIATAFGGGFGRKGLVCGCVTGALMAIGLKFGRTDNSQNNADAYEVTRKFCDAFEERFGSLFCRELIGIELTTEKGRRIFAEEKIGEEKCVCPLHDTVLMVTLAGEPLYTMYAMLIHSSITAVVYEIRAVQYMSAADKAEGLKGFLKLVGKP